MLKRKIEERLRQWKNSNDALLITGARQVGKSYIIREFCKKNFKNFIEINLHDHKEWIPILEQAQNADDLLFRLSSFAPEKLIEHQTVIFFDEIQFAKKCDLITLSKFLVDDGKYRYVFSGSLLGVELTNIVSYPVGYLREEKMFPLDFEEFLWANKADTSLITYLYDCFQNEKNVDSFIHEKMLDAFQKYLLIGGMPEAVQALVDTNNLQIINDVQKKIDSYYQKDVAKYGNESQVIHLEAIYKLIPQELNSKSKRFTLGKIGRGPKIDEISDDFLWLKNAGIALPTLNIDEPKTPLILSVNNRLLKLFHADTGILCYQLMDTGIQQKILSADKDINYGSIYENFVAEELTAHGYENLYYFSSKKQGEVDFIIEYKGDVLPIEVKSGKDYKRHSALNNLLSNPDYQIPQAIILCNGNIDRDEKKLYLPIYMVMFLQKEKGQNISLQLDLSDLKAK